MDRGMNYENLYNVVNTIMRESVDMFNRYHSIIRDKSSRLEHAVSIRNMCRVRKLVPMTNPDREVSLMRTLISRGLR